MDYLQSTGSNLQAFNRHSSLYEQHMLREDPWSIVDRRNRVQMMQLEEMERRIKIQAQEEARENAIKQIRNQHKQECDDILYLLT